MSKLKIWHAGEESEALCPECKTWRTTKFEYRDVALAKSKMTVSDVLVGVCTVCDTIATIPQQSAPKLHEARQPEPKRIEARIPKELRDTIGVIAATFGGEPEAFTGGLLRYYLRRMVDDQGLARRIASFADSEEAKGTPGGRIVLRLDTELLNNVLKVAKRVRIADKSALVRGIIVAAKHDAYDTPHAKRRDAMGAIAAAAGAW